MSAEEPRYEPPLALTIVSSISIGLAGVAALWILLDILQRRGWRSMMGIMIPVYVINALYLWPITLWTYLKYGRPTKPENQQKSSSSSGGHHHRQRADVGHEAEEAHSTQGSGSIEAGPHVNDSEEEINGTGVKDVYDTHGSSAGQDHSGHDMAGHHHQHHGGGERPMFANITVAVCHCGAGCVLGDIIGEWLVYGADITINGRLLWPEFLIDFAFAMAFGIIFQYFSIAPMARNYGAKTILRAAKADILSLIFFEIGLFAWMAIFQIAIFRWKLEMITVTYWWMMQIGMFLGHWTSVPINHWLIKKGIKEPCA